MKYTLTINQKQALELGLTNVSQSVILGLIADAHSWAENEIIDGVVYFWTARQKIADELPLLDLKSDSVYRHLKSLEKLGLIDYIKLGKKDCVKLTKLGKSYYVGNKSENDTNSEINPSKFGNKSENNSEINPTYKNTNLIRATRDKYTSLLSAFKKGFNSDIKVSDKTILDFIKYRAEIKKPIKTSKPIKLYILELAKCVKAGYDKNEVIELMKSKEWQSLKIDWIKKELSKRESIEWSNHGADYDDSGDWK